jgi:Lon-like protease
VSRRALTLWLAALLALVLGAGSAYTQVPYVSLVPGETFDTLGTDGGTPVIEVSGRPTYPTEGHLDLTTVGVRDHLTLAEAVAGWLNREEAVVPREIIFPPDQTDEQVQQANTQEMTQSQSSATTAALTSLRIPSQVVVTSVTDRAPAQGKLAAGDVLTTVDGAPATSSATLRDLIAKHAPGQTVRIGYTRAGQSGEASIVTAPAADDPARPVIGVAPTDRFPVTVTIHLEDVGGPSAGLMFALGIIDKLEPGPLNGGRYIAGTGTIDPAGKVGPIGGIAQKLVASRHKGATVFLTPADNCAEALANAPRGLELVKVASLTDALAALSTLRGGGTPAGCAP